MSERANTDLAPAAMQLTYSRRAVLFVLALLCVIALDFLAHAGLMARFYFEGSPFLLAPIDGFVRIPAGYLSFAVLVGYLIVLLPSLGVHSWTGGLSVGALTGGVFGLSQSLGLWSISTADPALLIGWALAYFAEFAVAGGIVGLGLQGARTRTMWLLVGLIILSAVVVTIILQNAGLAPAHLSKAA
jgi:hypothetical protein